MQADSTNWKSVSTTLLGLQRFVRQKVDEYLRSTKGRQELQQRSSAGAGVTPRQPVSPAVRVLQHNTRLIVLTLDLLRLLRVPTTSPLGISLAALPDPSQPVSGSAALPEPPLIVTQPTGYAQSWAASCAVPLVDPLRASAARLLVAFVGATLGSAYNVVGFVDEAIACYG